MGLFSFLFGKKKKNEPTAEGNINAVPATQSTEVDPPAPKLAPQKKTAPVAEKEVPEVKKTVAKKPAAPVAKPAEAAKKPAAPVTKPAEAAKKPAAPVAKPAEAAKKPATPVAKPAEAASKPVAPAVKKAVEETPKQPSATPKNEYFSKTGRFEIKRSKDGRYVFNLYAPNRVIIATSQVYSSAQSALTGIKSVMANADRAPVEDQTLKTYETLGYPKWEMYTDKSGQYRFRLLAANGGCVCHSQGYTTKASCKNGIESIAKNAKTSVIDKAYLK